MLRLGTAKVDITPTKPVPLAGFEARNGQGPSEGVSHDLYARILFFRFDQPGGASTSVVLVSADLIWWGNDRVPQLRRKIQKQWKVDEVLLHATHTHSGPQTCRNLSTLIGEADDEYIRYLESTLLHGIAQAADNLEEVTGFQGRGLCDIAINRRLLQGDRCIMSPNPNGPIDPELTVIRFRTLRKRNKAVIVHYACHPTTTIDNFISSEFTGVAMEALEKSLGRGAVAVYLQGACGDIAPSEKGRFYSGGDEEVRHLGSRLARAVVTVLKRSMVPLHTVPLQSERKSLTLPLQGPPSQNDLIALESESGVVGEWSRFLLQSPRRPTRSTTLEVTKLTLADELTLIAMNAEVVVEYGLFLKQTSKGQALPLGYCNGIIGYIPTAQQLQEGGYESLDSTYYFFMPAPYKPGVEQRLKRFLQKTIKPDER